jgi:hypothetical protein
MNMFSATSINGKHLFEVTSGWSTSYIEVGNSGIFNSNDTRYYYNVIRPEDIINGSMFVKFENREMVPDGSSAFRFYKTPVEELSTELRESPVGWYVLIWMLGSALTAGLVFLFYYADNHWLHGKEEREVSIKKHYYHY